MSAGAVPLRSSKRSIARDGTGRHACAMTTASAEISSAATALEELAGRLAGLGDDYVLEEREELASELYSAEASLQTVARRLRRLSDTQSN